MFVKYVFYKYKKGEGKKEGKKYKGLPPSRSPNRELTSITKEAKIRNFYINKTIMISLTEL